MNVKKWNVVYHSVRVEVQMVHSRQITASVLMLMSKMVNSTNLQHHSLLRIVTAITNVMLHSITILILMRQALTVIIVTVAIIVQVHSPYRLKHASLLHRTVMKPMYNHIHYFRLQQQITFKTLLMKAIHTSPTKYLITTKQMEV